MDSARASDNYERRTRLQDTVEKRKAEEQLKEKAELKRQKKMFAPRKLIGPHDLLVNSNLPKIKLEEDVACSDTVVKEKSLEETLEESSLINENSELMINCDGSVDMKMDIEQKVFVSEFDENELNDFSLLNDRLPVSSLESEDDQFLQEQISLLKVLGLQKDQEINQLIKLIKGLLTRPDNEVVYDETELVSE